MLNSSQHLSALHWEVLGVLRGPNYHITAELCSIEEVRDTDAEGGAVNNPEAGELRAKMENETVKPVKEEEKVEELMKDEDDPEMAGLCEYEKIRLRNIRRREALFAELDLKEAKHEAREASGVKKEAVSTRRGGTEEGLGGMDHSWDKEEQHIAEVGQNPANGSPGPADNPEAKDKLILDTMGFSSFGDPNYQRRKIQSV